MGSTAPWETELAFWTLKHILPKEYPKYNSVSILNSAAEYIQNLLEKRQTVRCGAIQKDNQLQSDSDSYGTDEHTLVISDEEEIELLDNLGLKKGADEFVGVQPEWLETISVKSEYIFSDDEEKCTYFNAPKPQPSETKVKRPGNGFIRFSTDKRKEVLRLHPQSDNRKVSKILGIMWRKLTPEEKKPYIDQFVDHINVIRIAHPEWNYAASRAKSNAPSTKNAVVLEERLRVRKAFSAYVQQAETTEMQMPRRKLKGNSKRKSRKKQVKVSTEEKITWTSCDACQKWRKMPSYLNVDTLPFVWVCSMNTDPMYNSCDKEQEDE